MIIYLFGIACAGKTYIGELLARKYGFTFYDADAWIDENYMQEFKLTGSFSVDTRAHIHKEIANRITTFDRNKSIVIAQASIKECNRQQILAANPDVIMVWVKADLQTLLDRAAKRNNYVTADSIHKMWKNFDIPKDKSTLIIDNGCEAVPLLKQLSFSD